MGTPLREAILDDVQTTLEGITVANGYKTTVVTVERVIRHWGDVGSSLRPWLGYMSQPQRFTHQPFGQMRTVMPLYIAGHITASTKAAAAAALTNLEDDIIAALEADTTRGGNAVMTHIISQQDDAGDPDTVDSQGVSGTLELIAEVVYQRDTGSS